MFFSNNPNHPWICLAIYRCPKPCCFLRIWSEFSRKKIRFGWFVVRSKWLNSIFPHTPTYFWWSFCQHYIHEKMGKKQHILVWEVSVDGKKVHAPVDMVNISIVYRVLYIQPVVVWDFFHQTVSPQVIIWQSHHPHPRYPQLPWMLSWIHQRFPVRIFVSRVPGHNRTGIRIRRGWWLQCILMFFKVGLRYFPQIGRWRGKVYTRKNSLKPQRIHHLFFTLLESCKKCFLCLVKRGYLEIEMAASCLRTGTS